MEAHMILLNLVFLIGIGIIIGILIIVLIMNGKINRLVEKVTQINDNLNHINGESNQDFYSNGQKTKFSKDKVKSYQNTINRMSYTSEVNSKVASTSEADFLQPKRKSNQTIGIVFCRNCASQFTSDKDQCPICGAKRH